MQEYVLLGVISRSMLAARLQRLEQTTIAPAWSADAPRARVVTRAESIFTRRSSGTVGSPDGFFEGVPEEEVCAPFTLHLLHVC